MLTWQFMSAITDFTNKWFSTNRVHKMFHETTISLHSLLLHWITILLLTDITVFVFNMATTFIFLSGTPRNTEEWCGPIVRSLHWMAWPWCTLGSSTGMVMHPEKIIKTVGSYPTPKPGPSVLQKALQQPAESTRLEKQEPRAWNTQIPQTQIIRTKQNVTVMVGFFTV